MKQPAFSLDTCRELYNASLQERRDAYQINHVSLNYNSQSAQLPGIKAIRPDVAAVHSQVLQDVLRRSQKAFDNFFRRGKAGQETGLPKIQGQGFFDSFVYPQSGFRLEGDKLHLSKIGSCRVRLSRPIEGRIKTCTIKREADGWYVVLPLNAINPASSEDREGGGDRLGIECFAAVSNGERVENPKHYRAAESELKRAQRTVTRRKNKRSNRRRKAINILAKKHLHIKRQRADFPGRRRLM
ncbi:MAG: transposase [Acidobacteria bacterium]|nr:transposase [Acidobacteriota bacterium]